VARTLPPERRGGGWGSGFLGNAKGRVGIPRTRKNLETAPSIGERARICLRFMEMENSFLKGEITGEESKDPLKKELPQRRANKRGQTGEFRD